MASVPTKTADELTTAIRSVVDRALESTVREQVAARGREVATVIAETAGTVAERASEAASDAWRETTPQRREALKNAERMQADALRWSRRTWTSQLRPALQKAFKDGSLRLTAAGASVPITKEIADRARERLGVQRREERRWRTFFLGLVVGAAIGAVAAILTAPKPGREVRDDLATRARGAAEGASEWSPLFQRPLESVRTKVAEATDGADSIAPADQPEAAAHQDQEG